VLGRFGRLDVVVANAGIQHVAAIDEFPEEGWDTIISLMLTSPFLLAKHAWGALRASRGGRFTLIASVHGTWRPSTVRWALSRRSRSRARITVSRRFRSAQGT
jgi:NAD(P)-dependent dehydrogenase (short-subunit alcohol dehydrogenase family)